MQKKRHFDFWRFAKAKRTKKAWTNVSPIFFRQADVRFAKAKRNRQKNPKRGQSRFQFFLRFAEAKRTKTQRMCISPRRNAKNAHLCDPIQCFNKAKPTFFTNLSQRIQIRHAKLIKKSDTLSRTVRQLPSLPFGSCGSLRHVGPHAWTENCRVAGGLSLRCPGRLVGDYSGLGESRPHLLSRTVGQLLRFPLRRCGSLLLVGLPARGQRCCSAGRLSLRCPGHPGVGDPVLLGGDSRTHAHDVQQIFVAQHPRAFGQPLLFFFECSEAQTANSLSHAKGLAASS